MQGFLIALITAATVVLPASGRAQDRTIAPRAFYGHLTAVLEARADLAATIETAPLLNRMAVNNDRPLARGDARTLCYLDFGNFAKFLALAEKGTKSVVIDPGYLRGAGFTEVQALYQNLNSMSRILQGLDEKYQGHIILMRDVPAPGSQFAVDSTLIHEAIHAAAFAVNRMDLDQDGTGHDAPEYISDQLFKHQQLLLRYESRAWNGILPLVGQIVALQNSTASDADKQAGTSNLIREIFFVASRYLDAITDLYEREYVGNNMGYNFSEAAQLAAYWDGKVDWEGLLRDTRANVDFLQLMGAAMASGSGGDQAASDRFIDFFFKRKCAAN